MDFEFLARHQLWVALALAKRGIAFPEDDLEPLDDDEPSAEIDARWKARIKALCGLYQSVWTDRQEIERRTGRTITGPYQLPFISERDLDLQPTRDEIQ